MFCTIGSILSPGHYCVSRAEMRKSFGPAPGEGARMWGACQFNWRTRGVNTQQQITAFHLDNSLFSRYNGGWIRSGPRFECEDTSEWTADQYQCLILGDDCQRVMDSYSTPLLMIRDMRLMCAALLHILAQLSSLSFVALKLP